MAEGTPSPFPSERHRSDDAPRGERSPGAREGGFRIRLSDNEMRSARALQEAFGLRSTVAVLGFALRTLGQQLEEGKLEELVAQHRAQAPARGQGDGRPEGRRERPEGRGGGGRGQEGRGTGGGGRPARVDPFARPPRPEAAPEAPPEEAAPETAAEAEVAAAVGESMEPQGDESSSGTTAETSGEPVVEPAGEPVAAEALAAPAEGAEG